MGLVFIDGGDHLVYSPLSKYNRLDSLLSWGVDGGQSVSGKYNETPSDWELVRTGQTFPDKAYIINNSYFGTVVHQLPVAWSGGIVGLHFKPTTVIYAAAVTEGWFLAGMKEPTPGHWHYTWTLGSRAKPGDSQKGRLELNNQNGGTAWVRPSTTYSSYDLLAAGEFHAVEVWLSGGHLRVYCGGELVCEDDVLESGTTALAIMRKGMFWPAFGFDNLHVFDEDHSFTPPLGECRVTTLAAFADETAGWSPSTGGWPHWALLWEHAGGHIHAPDGTHDDYWATSGGDYPNRSDYVQASGASDLDFLLSLPSAKLIGGDIIGVQVNAVCAINDPLHSDVAGNDSQLAFLARQGDGGSLLASSSQQALRPYAKTGTPIVWKNHLWPLTLNPAGAAWTEAQLRGTSRWQFGLRYQPRPGAPYETPVRCAQFIVERLHRNPGGGADSGSRYRAF